MNIDSPATLAQLTGIGGVEMGLGMSMSGMSQMGFGNMGMGMELGGSRSVQARAVDDEERRKRLEAVIATLRTRPGRVSEEALERLGRRLGLDTQCDPPLGQAKPGWNGVRQLTIAGQTFMVDISSRENSIENLSVIWGTDLTKIDESASKLLKGCITPPSGGSSITHTLEKFEQNLERLARLDKLEGQSFNCYESIKGVYESLKRLYEHEKKAALALLGEDVKGSDQRAVRDTMCKRSGRPRLNAHRRIGVSVEYWMDGVYQYKSNPSTTSNGSSNDAMDVDQADPSEFEDEGDSPVYSLIIDCESSPATLYPPIRTSTAWISEAVEKISDHELFGQQTEVDWQDPPPSYLHSPHEDTAPQPDPMNLDLGMGKLPNVRFVARLDPPLPMPVQVWNNILHAVNVEPDLHSLTHLSYDGLLLRAERLDGMAEAQDVTAQLERQLHSTRNIFIPLNDGKGETERPHFNTLYAKAEFGKVLEEIPFSHPREIINILGTLRQYAFLNSLLKRSFTSQDLSKARTANGIVNGITNGIHSQHLTPLSVDVLLHTVSATSTSPQLIVTFPKPTLPVPASPPVAEEKPPRTPPMPAKKPLVPYSSSTEAPFDDMSLDDMLAAGTATADETDETRLLSLTVEISAQNADVTIIDQNVTSPLPPIVADAKAADGEKANDPGEGEQGAKEEEADDAMSGISKDIAKEHEEETKRMEKVQRLAKALEVCGDLDVWVEWIGRQL